MGSLEIAGADLALYVQACKQRLREIEAQQQELAEEAQHLHRQLTKISGVEEGQEPAQQSGQPKTWRAKLNAFAAQRNRAFTYHEAADYLHGQGWHNNLSSTKLKGSVAATLARLSGTGDFGKATLNNGTNYGLPEWFEGHQIKKDYLPL